MGQQNYWVLSLKTLYETLASFELSLFNFDSIRGEVFGFFLLVTISHNSEQDECEWQMFDDSGTTVLIDDVNSEAPPK